MWGNEIFLIFVKRVVKGVEVGLGLEVFECFDWVLDW